MADEKNTTNLAKVIKEPDLSAFSPRERILAAALKLFVEQGYFNTNVPDLSRESKCSVGSIYHNFKNKEEVASALYHEAISSFRRALEQSLGNTTDVREVIRTVVKSFLQFSEINHHLSKYIWLCRHNEFMTGIIRHPTTVGFDKFGRTMTKVIRQAIRDGTLRPYKANIIWTILFGVPAGYVRDWLDGYNPDPPTAVSDELAEVCWRALAKAG